MSFWVADLTALEVLDSRGRPTVQVRLTLEGGAVGVAGVPSGASTGAGEAVERRDGEPLRYGGLGVTGAVAAVNGEIHDHLSGRRWGTHADVDHALIELDGTQNKGRLGANAVVGVSMALARALADLGGLPLYAWLARDASAMRLPVPHFNVINGGAHAANPLAFQEFMIAPLGAPSLREAVRAGAEVYAALRRRITAADRDTGLGDEGGFAPDLAHPEEALELIVGAIADAGYRTGRDGVAIALDPAATGFRDTDGLYRLPDAHLTATELIDYYAGLVAAYPIWSIEDGVAEDDDSGWDELTARLGDQVQIVGDDNFVTNPAIIAAAIDHGVANAALIKVNQVGTVTETLAAIDLCRARGYGQMISHRSGETPDTFIADLAVASGCGQIKAGAPARGERVAKYNRLLEIAAADPSLPYGLPERLPARVHERA
jgi:enolase